MKLIAKILFTTIICLCSAATYAQKTDVAPFYYIINNGDTVLTVDMEPVSVMFEFKRPRFYKDLSRLTKAIAIAYPIAREVEIRFNCMNEVINKMDNERDIRRYVKSVESELKDIYTPILKHMTFYQGAILLKLIDRQTGESGYALLKELRNGFTAFFWNAIANIYGANLKMKYDPNGADKTMEVFVVRYEVSQNMYDQNPRPEYIIKK